MGFQGIITQKMYRVVSELKQKKPAITVLMLVFNGDSWLGEAIISVLNQTFTDFEFIIVDDGSTDSSLEIIKRFQLVDSRVVVINKRNTGLADSLNCGIRSARGEWIARIDADDICEPSRLAQQVGFVQRNPEVILCGSDYLEIDQGGVVIKYQRYPPRHKVLVSNLRRLKRFFPHSSAFFSRAIVNKLGGYRIQFKKAQDWDLWARIADSGLGQIACVNEPLVRIRNHLEQVSLSNRDFPQAVYGVAAITCSFLRSRGFPDPANAEYQGWVDFLVWLHTKMREDFYFDRLSIWFKMRSDYFGADKNGCCHHIIDTKQGRPAAQKMSTDVSSHLLPWLGSWAERSDPRCG